MDDDLSEHKRTVETKIQVFTQDIQAKPSKCIKLEVENYEPFVMYIKITFQKY